MKQNNFTTVLSQPRVRGDPGGRTEERTEEDERRAHPLPGEAGTPRTPRKSLVIGKETKEGKGERSTQDRRKLLTALWTLLARDTWMGRNI